MNKKKALFVGVAIATMLFVLDLALKEQPKGQGNRITSSSEIEFIGPGAPTATFLEGQDFISLDVQDPTRDVIWTFPKSWDSKTPPTVLVKDWNITDGDLDTKLSGGHTVRDLAEACFYSIRLKTPKP